MAGRLSHQATHMKLKILGFILAALVLGACGKKEQPTPAPSQKAKAEPTEVVCSLAPSQSTIISNLSSAAGGSAAAVAALGQALGLTVVTHSSGALILSGGSGYVAGTLGAAAAGPVVVGAGVLVAGVAGMVELLCVPKNHPDMVAKVEAAAVEFALRSKAASASAAKSVQSFTAEQRIALIKSGEDAIAYANRKSVAISATSTKK